MSKIRKLKTEYVEEELDWKCICPECGSEVNVSESWTKIPRFACIVSCKNCDFVAGCEGINALETIRILYGGE